MLTQARRGGDPVPVDLAQAVLLLAAEFYENRHDLGQRVAGLPLVVQALIERWRTVQVFQAGASMRRGAAFAQAGAGSAAERRRWRGWVYGSLGGFGDIVGRGFAGVWT